MTDTRDDGRTCIAKLFAKHRGHHGDPSNVDYAYADLAIGRLRAPTSDTEDDFQYRERAIRYEDGHPHESHRWVSGGEYGGSPPWVCGDCGVDIEDDEALDPCKAAEHGEDDVPLWIRRALSLVERALESEDGMRSVMKQTGGSAPELVQGILDGIVRLRASDTEDVGEEIADLVRKWNDEDIPPLDGYAGCADGMYPCSKACDCEKRVHALLARLRRTPETEGRPEIVCLCGSTRFKDAYIEANKSLTLAGKIVLSVGLFGHADNEALTTEQKRHLDTLHLRKIDVADRVLVLDVDGYIGESTSREIAYAHANGKPVDYLNALATQNPNAGGEDG